MSQYYNGGICNVVKSRLGIDIDIEDMKISLPEDIEAVMNCIKPSIDKIIRIGKEEKKRYLKYINYSNQRVAVIDVGYMGTIQYYLSKLMDEKIDGRYLCLHYKAKPFKIGCDCKGLTEVSNPLEERKNRVFKNQLYLESVLKAPYGQLLYFERLSCV